MGVLRQAPGRSVGRQFSVEDPQGSLPCRLMQLRCFGHPLHAHASHYQQTHVRVHIRVISLAGRDGFAQRLVVKHIGAERGALLLPFETETNNREVYDVQDTY